MFRTRQKLDEAAFFLARVEEHAAETEKFLSDRNARNVFCYYLSAFVSAARSTAWIMRSEWCGCEGWQTWWKEQGIHAPKELLKIFNDLRVRSEKTDPLQPAYLVRFEDDGGPPIKPHERLSKAKLTIAVETSTSSRRVDGLTLTIDELEGEDLLENCRAYFQDLQRLVAACEGQFGQPVTN